MKEIIYLYTPGCLACMMLAPKIEAVREKMNIVCLNELSHSELTKKYNIEYFPSLLFLENKKLVNILIGEKKIKKYLETI